MGFGRTGSDYKSSYRYAHRYAVKYRHQRDHLQKLLTARVIEVRRLHRELVQLRRRILHRPDSLEALRLAAITWSVSYDRLYRIASCESTGGDGLNPNAKNPSSTAAGLGQFLDSTWASTIYHDESVYSPYANALAMGKEVHDGHTGWQWAASEACWS